MMEPFPKFLICCIILSVESLSSSQQDDEVYFMGNGAVQE